MDWFILFLSLELGFIPQGGMTIQNLSHESFENALYTELEVEVRLFNVRTFNLFFGGSVRTNMLFHDKGPFFNPDRAWYEFSAGIRAGLFELRYEHACIHPVLSRFMMNDKYYMLGDYDAISIKISGEIGRDK